jgi:hypothetical protein
MNIVANGSPDASTTACSASRCPSRVTRIPGSTHAWAALSTRFAIASTTKAGEQVVLAVTQGVMHERPRRLSAHVRHADEMKYGKMLRIAAADRGEHAQFADAVRRANGSHTVEACVAVCW